MRSRLYLTAYSTCRTCACSLSGPLLRVFLDHKPLTCSFAHLQPQPSALHLHPRGHRLVSPSSEPAGTRPSFPALALRLTICRRWCSITTCWAGLLVASARSSSCRSHLRSTAHVALPRSHFVMQLLSCEHNCIPVLPPEFSHCRSLTELNMGFNAFEIMPEVIKGITGLQVTRPLNARACVASEAAVCSG